MTDQSKIPPQLAQGIETLKKARDYISDPSRWCKGALAKRHGDSFSIYGSSTWYRDQGELQVCSIGALALAEQGCTNGHRIDNHANGKTCAGKFLSHSAREAGFGDIISANDISSTSHADILRIWDNAIAMAEKAAAEHVPE